MKTVEINTNYITLGQFLKYIGLINSGSGAKYYLYSNQVVVNNQLEQRRGKKLYDGDVIGLNNEKYIIKSNDNAY